jgi:hypothetical protein
MNSANRLRIVAACAGVFSSRGISSDGNGSSIIREYPWLKKFLLKVETETLTSACWASTMWNT